MKLQGAVRAVALVEGAKGALVLLAGAGALSLVHRDVELLAVRLLEHLHLNPAKRYPQIFIDSAAKLTDARLWTLAAFAAAYGAIRLAEAYGLWRGKRWAEWLAALSGGVYIPFELYELWLKPGWLPAAAFAINVVVVALMAGALRSGHAAKEIQQ
jgi:uncharacterized membrane protein (DUF2068 family)